jgi:hypothetical protein
MSKTANSNSTTTVKDWVNANLALDGLARLRTAPQGGVVVRSHGAAPKSCAAALRRSAALRCSAAAAPCHAAPRHNRNRSRDQDRLRAWKRSVPRSKLVNESFRPDTCKGNFRNFENVFSVTVFRRWEKHTLLPPSRHPLAPPSLHPTPTHPSYPLPTSAPSDTTTYGVLRYRRGWRGGGRVCVCVCVCFCV